MSAWENDPEALLAEIVAAAAAMTPVATVRGYAFGSILTSKFRWADVDILVVCDDSTDVPSVRPALASVCNRAPIDLLIMSSNEESELNFISGQGCQRIFEVRHSSG